MKRHEVRNTGMKILKIINHEEGEYWEMIKQLLITHETRSAPTEDDIIENKLSESEIYECSHKDTKTNEQRREEECQEIITVDSARNKICANWRYHREQAIWKWNPWIQSWRYQKIMNYEEGGCQEIIKQLLIAQETRSAPTEDDIIENKIYESEVYECDYELTKTNEQRRRMPRDNQATVNSARKKISAPMKNKRNIIKNESRFHRSIST